MISKTVKYKGADVQVRELTVAELRDALESPEMTMLDKVFDGELITEAILLQSCGLGADELQSGYPSEVRLLVEACKEANPDFLSGMASLLARKGR